MFKNKFKASFIHLLLSFSLVAMIMVFVINFWYPNDFLDITNFKNIALLIISIDLVLGPLLTFVIFNKNKPKIELTRDIAIIAIIQISAMAYGVNALYQAHPLFITYNHGYFNLVNANEVSPEKAKYDEFRISKFSSPKLAYAKMPDDHNLQTEIMLGVDLKGEPDIDKRTEYFEPHEKHMDDILKSSLDTVKLFAERNLTDSTRIFLQKYGDYKDDYAYLPLKGITGDAIIVLDKKTAKLVSTIVTSPWEFQLAKNQK